MWPWRLTFHEPAVVILVDVIEVWFSCSVMSQLVVCSSSKQCTYTVSNNLQSHRINLVSESPAVLLMVLATENWCVLSTLPHGCFCFEKYENTHSVHVITKWWWKEVGVSGDGGGANWKLHKTSNCSSDWSGNNAEHSRGISFLKLSGNPELLCWSTFSATVNIMCCVVRHAG